MNVLALLNLQPCQVVSYLNPICRLPEVNQLHIVRHTPVPFPSEKIVWHPSGGGRAFFSVRRLMKTADQVLRNTKIDYVVAINPVPYGLAAWRLARRHDKPVAVSLIGSDYRYHCHAWYGKAIHAVLRRCNAITGTGEEMVSTLRSWGIDRESVAVLPHALEMERFRPTKPLAERKYDAICVGQLIHRKRVDLIIRAFSQVLKSRGQARLAIVGEGPLRGELEQLAKSLGAAGQIDFLGHQNHVERLFNEARVHLLTSEVEGLPFVMLEAMACGCVPIVTRCGTIEDVLVDGKNGYLVAQQDYQTVARRWLTLLDHPDQLAAISANALEVRTDYSWAAAEAVWQQIFERVSLRRRHPHAPHIVPSTQPIGSRPHRLASQVGAEMVKAAK